MRIYKIMGNDKYLLSEDLKVIPIDKENTPLLRETDKCVYINLYNLKKKWVEKEWLKLLAIYCINLPMGYEEYIYNIKFKPMRKPNLSMPDKHMVIASF